MILDVNAREKQAGGDTNEPLNRATIEPCDLR